MTVTMPVEVRVLPWGVATARWLTAHGLVALVGLVPLARARCGRRRWTVRAPFRLAAFLLLGITCAGAARAAEQPGVKFGALAAAETVLSGDTDPAVVPGIRLDVAGPFAFGYSTPLEFRATLQLTALPGETVDLGNVATFKAAALTAALSRQVGRSVRGTQTIRTLIYGEAGFATRLPRDPGPLDRYPRRVAFGLEVREESKGAFLRVAGGRDDVAGPVQWRQLMLAGQVPVYGLAKQKGRPRANVVLGGDVVLTLGRSNFGPDQRDVTRIWVGVRAGS